MSLSLVTLLMIASLFLLLTLGLPICFALGGSAIIFATLLWGPSAVNIIVMQASVTMNATVLIAVPLFVFMSYTLEKSGVADDLYVAMHRWMGHINGGLAAGSVLVCTVVAAMSGISSTGVLMMGIVAFPSMVKRHYDKKLVIGAIMAGGALGPLIPPSLVLIVYGLVSGLSIGKLFLAGIMPGIMLSGLFTVYILIRCKINPTLGPSLPPEEQHTWREKFVSTKGLILPLATVFAVLGSIFFGLATPTEAAAVGAFLVIIAAAIKRRLNWKMMKDGAYETLKIVGMVMWLIFAATYFATIYQGLGMSTLIQNILLLWPINKWVIITVMQLVWIILGCLMDSLSILMLTGPIFLPVAKALGLDPIWFAMLYAVNTEMGYLTPPFGVNLFIIKGVLEDTSMGEIYIASLPFVLLQAFGLLMLILFPKIATWLPNYLFG